MSVDRINIRPGVSVLAVLRHLNYKPWFALAEFVDNSLESFLQNREALTSIDGGGFKLKVSIDFDSAEPCRLTIRDNAAGIKVSDYERAFRPAELPPTRTGLSEFGMGMKSAACWFSPQWLVRTSALGEAVGRTVRFDIASIVEDRIESLEVSHERAREADHFTEIVLSNLYTPLRSKTIRKIKDHLSHIYRHFTRNGLLELTFNNDVLVYEEPRVLLAPYVRDKDGGDILWKKEIDFDFGRDMRVHGFAALRAKGSTALAGFALFRRNRLIQGSADEGYRPQQILVVPTAIPINDCLESFISTDSR